MTLHDQLIKARAEIQEYNAKNYPYGQCDDCKFPLDEHGECTRGNYLYDED